MAAFLNNIAHLLLALFLGLLGLLPLRWAQAVGAAAGGLICRSGTNRVECTVTPAGGKAMLSLLITGPSNDGGTLDGLRWLNRPG